MLIGPVVLTHASLLLAMQCFLVIILSPGHPRTPFPEFEKKNTVSCSSAETDYRAVANAVVVLLKPPSYASSVF